MLTTFGLVHVGLTASQFGAPDTQADFVATQHKALIAIKDDQQEAATL